MSVLRQTLRKTSEYWPDVVLEMSESKDPYDRLVWRLSSIVVPKGQRKQGTGREVMYAITKAADAAGAIITLTPSTDFGATSVARLRRFYGSFGFRRNRGARADHSLSDAMYRLPRAANPPDIGVDLGGDYEPVTDGWWFHGEAWMTLEGGEELRFVTDVYVPRDGVVEVYTQESSRPGSDKVPLDDWQIEALVTAVQDGAAEFGLRG